MIEQPKVSNGKITYYNQQQFMIKYLKIAYGKIT